MSEDQNTRISQVLINGQWENIKPIDIKKDMTFRMFEDDGTPVTWLDESSWVAVKDAYYNEDGIVCIDYSEELA